ncbi:MAG: hypothetical protein GWN93_07255 [Deltaproteobacteria bacterium]|nr:hypothetical protein [Deltaproteobacteria bacterium]
MMPVLEANYGDGFHRIPFGGKWKRFGRLPESERKNITCLTGHIPWGLHKFLPQKHQYATMLRHPLERIASLYLYIRRTTSHRWHSRAKHQSIADFAFSKMSEVDNGMVRWISGRFDVGNMALGYRVGQSDLEAAKRHLSKFAAVGFVEEFDASLALFAETFGWKHTEYVVKGKAPARKKTIAKLLVKDLAVMEGVNWFDMALYRWAREKFAS